MTIEFKNQSMEESTMQFMRMSALLTLLAIPGVALAHPGGLDKNGCHNDKKTGDYHCHKGPNAGKNFTSKEAMLKETGSAVAQPAKPTPKTMATPAAAASAPAASAPGKPDVKTPAPAAQAATAAAKPEAKAEPKAKPEAKTSKKKKKSKADTKAEDKK